MTTVVKGKILRQDIEWFDGVEKNASRKDATGGFITGLVMGYEVDVLASYGKGLDYTRQTIAECTQRIGSASVTLIFNPGTWVIDDNLTIGSNFVCRVPAGAVFDVASGKTLTFSGPVIHDAQTWTSGSGTVTENGTRYLSGKLDLTGAVVQGTNALVFEGSSSDANRTTFVITNPTGTRTITFPDADVNLASVPTLSGNNTFTGTNTHTGANTFTNADAGAAAGPKLTLHRNSASPAASDVMGAIPFDGEDSGDTQTTYAQIQGEIVDPTDTSEEGRLAVQSIIAGTLATRLYVGNGIYTVGGSDQGANTIQGFSGVYDGANRVYSAGNTVPEAGLASSAVSQAKLKTLTASGTTTIGIGADASVTLTGGTYSWWTASAVATSGLVGWGNGDVVAGLLGLYNSDGVQTRDFYRDERYISASPPYTHGPLFVFLMLDAAARIINIEVGADPTWAYHGPTDIVPQYTRNGRPYRRVKKYEGMCLKEFCRDDDRLRRYMNGDVEAELAEQEITLAYKDSDMNVMPHPWCYNSPSYFTDRTVVMLEPGTPLMLRMYDILEQSHARDVKQIIRDGYLDIGTDPIDMTGPSGVSIVRASWRITR